MNRGLSRVCIALIVLASQTGFVVDLLAADGFGYRPDGMMMWDTWFVEDRGQVHMFHLQRLAPGSKRSALEADHIGRAVSRDLIHWTEQPLTVGPSVAGGLDDLQPWTGCAVMHEGAFPGAFRRTDASIGLLIDRGEAVIQRLAIYRQEPQNTPK
jgi:sucrose-6-phosphate hydrolase SacC (GH32 family)